MSTTQGIRDVLLWLDDKRFPPTNKWLWVKTAEEAIEALKKKDVLFASLDHDLAPEHYAWAPNYDEVAARKTNGQSVTRWLAQVYRHEDEDILPPDGIRVHSMNPIGSARMVADIDFCYGEDFQCTHKYEALPWQLYGQPNGWYSRASTASMRTQYQGCPHC